MIPGVCTVKCNVADAGRFALRGWIVMEELNE
jgi:hypothetical protein